MPKSSLKINHTKSAEKGDMPQQQQAGRDASGASLMLSVKTLRGAAVDSLTLLALAAAAGFVFRKASSQAKENNETNRRELTYSKDNGCEKGREPKYLARDEAAKRIAKSMIGPSISSNNIVVFSSTDGQG